MRSVDTTQKYVYKDDNIFPLFCTLFIYTINLAQVPNIRKHILNNIWKDEKTRKTQLDVFFILHLHLRMKPFMQYHIIK